MVASGAALGAQELHERPTGPVARLLDAGESALADVDGEAVFVHAVAPRPAMYVFGAIDHAAALARVGKLLGYRVTVCDARAAFVTPERFPEADELVVEWPDRFLARAPVDASTVICVLTHDEKFDVPALIAALETPAVYIGAMGSKVTTADREERLRAEGVDDAGLGRIHAPIGLAIGARSPEEVAVAIGAEIVEATALARRRATADTGGASRCSPRRARARAPSPAPSRTSCRSTSYLTVSVPFMPPAAWPGSVQRNGYLPFFSVAFSVAVFPVFRLTVFLPAILKSWLMRALVDDLERGHALDDRLLRERDAELTRLAEGDGDGGRRRRARTAERGYRRDERDESDQDDERRPLPKRGQETSS